MTFHFEIYREAEEAPLVTAELVYVNADPSSMKAAPLPDALRERVRRYERTAPQAGSGGRISRSATALRWGATALPRRRSSISAGASIRSRSTSMRRPPRRAFSAG